MLHVRMNRADQVHRVSVICISLKPVVLGCLVWWPRTLYTGFDKFGTWPVLNSSNAKWSISRLCLKIFLGQARKFVSVLYNPTVAITEVTTEWWDRILCIIIITHIVMMIEGRCLWKVQKSVAVCKLQRLQDELRVLCVCQRWKPLSASDIHLL